MDIFNNDFGNGPLEVDPTENHLQGDEIITSPLVYPEDPQGDSWDIAFEDSLSYLEMPIVPNLADIIDATEYPSNGLTKLYGNPELDAEHWHQQTYPDTCAIVSQEFILETYLDHDFSEEELSIEAISKGYYFPGIGTYPDYVGNLLEDYGIEVERSEGNTIEDIANRLSNNQKIIVGIDANEIWTPSGEEQLKDLLYMPEANHAVMVTGYDDQSQIVYLNDPGHPNGAEMEVALKDFENAWNDSCNFMVSTVNAPSIVSA